MIKLKDILKEIKLGVVDIDLNDMKDIVPKWYAMLNKNPDFINYLSKLKDENQLKNNLNIMNMAFKAYFQAKEQARPGYKSGDESDEYKIVKKKLGYALEKVLKGINKNSGGNSGQSVY